nr:unnamed protein product [Callosobruchus chinensis]
MHPSTKQRYLPADWSLQHLQPIPILVEAALHRPDPEKTEEICNELSSIGVIEVRRIKSKRDGMLVDTANHILTFNKPTLPKEIKVAMYNLKVRPYIPSPLRCFNCQKFGHTTTRCSFQKICVCGKQPHEGTPCDSPVICPNCQGNHPAQSKQCIKYKEEFAIQQLKVVEKISYFEAKNRVAVQTPTPNVTYSAAARSTTLIDQILPALKTIIQETINREVQQLRFPVPQFTTAQRPRTSSLSLPTFPKPTDKCSSEKRKRESTATPGPSEEEAASSDDSATKSTKKKGWPKGKPRK